MGSDRRMEGSLEGRVNREDVIVLADWLYDQRPAVRAYKETPDLMMELLINSLAFRLRRHLSDRSSERWLDEFREHVEYGPWDANEGKAK